MYSLPPLVTPPSNHSLSPDLSSPRAPQVNYWLGGLIEVKSNDLYRMKGVLAIKDFDKRFVFQARYRLSCASKQPQVSVCL